MITMKINGISVSVEDGEWSCENDTLLETVRAISEYAQTNRGGYVIDMDRFLVATVASKIGAESIDMTQHVRVESSPGVIY